MNAKLRLPGCTLTQEDFNKAIDTFIDEHRQELLDGFEETFDFWGDDIEEFLDTKRSQDLEPMSDPEDSDQDDIYDQADAENPSMFRRAYHHKEVDEFGLWVSYTKNKIVDIEPEYW